MNKVPGFTAAASLREASASHQDRSLVTSVVAMDREVQPAQIATIERPPIWTRNDVGDIYFRTRAAARQFQCLRSCYQDCLKKYPGEAWGCRWASEQCCIHDFHCYFCGR